MSDAEIIKFILWVALGFTALVGVCLIVFEISFYSSLGSILGSLSNKDKDGQKG